MEKIEIERAVRSLQMEIYNNARLIFETGIPPLTRLFEPDVAAQVCGYEYETRAQLGKGGSGQDKYETAGLIDNMRRTIVISSRFPYETQRFTGAHEIGHLVLHPNLYLHRDRPLSGVHSPQRSRCEQEADYFAACFLAPKKLVRSEFEKRFGRSPIPLTHAVAFHLNSSRAHEILNAPTGSLEFAAAFASATKFGSKRFDSMAHAFGMSTKAMAIRLQALNLISY